MEWKGANYCMSKHKHQLECSASEYFWLNHELSKATRNFQQAVFSPNANTPEQKEQTQAFMILITFFRKALGSFTVRSGTTVRRPIVISRQFLADLKTLDTTGLIDLEMVRKGNCSVPSC